MRSYQLVGHKIFLHSIGHLIAILLAKDRTVLEVVILEKEDMVEIKAIKESFK